MVAKALDCKDNVVTVDIDQGSKGGMAALLMCKSLVEAKEVDRALAIAADCVSPEPGSDMESTMGAGAAAFIIGAEDGIAEIKGYHSYTNETYDLWCYADDRFLQIDLDLYRPHFARAVSGSVVGLMTTLGTTPVDYNYAIFQQPNAREPASAARVLRFSREQIDPGIIVSNFGDCFSASALIGLARVLDRAEVGEKILLASYGAGCSDAFSLETAGGIGNIERPSTVDDFAMDKIYVDYPVDHRKPSYILAIWWR